MIGSAGDRPLGVRVMAGLAAIWNVAALNVSFVVVSLPLVTLPVTIGACLDTLHNWRFRGDDGVLFGFGRNLVSHPGRRWVTMAPGVGAMLLGAFEATYFLQYAGFIAVLCMTIGLVTAGIGVSLTVFSALFMAMSPDSSSREVWRLAIAVGAQRVWTTLPLMTGLLVAAVAIALIDPSLVVICVPVLLMWAWLVIAARAARQSGPSESDDH